MNITGTIIELNKPKEFGNFSKRSVVVKTDDQYPQELEIDFINKKIPLLDKFQVENKVSIDINIRGTKWTAKDGEVKRFTALQGWRIEENKEVTATDQNPDRVVDKVAEDLPF